MTTDKPATPAATYIGDVVVANLLKHRESHPLNDTAVTLRAGVTAPGMYAGAAALIGGTGRKGYVWAVSNGRAVCDFGTSGGSALRVVANVSDLLPVEE